MKKKWSLKKKIIMGIVSLVIILLITGITFLYMVGASSKNPQFHVFNDTIPADKVLTEDEMKNDLDFIVEKLKNVHPKTYNGYTNEEQEVIDNAYKRIDKPMKAEEFYFIANEVVCTMKDAHTSLHISNNDENTRLNLRLTWLEDGLYVKETQENLKKGDKILAFGNKNTEEIFNELSKLIPAENKYWARVIGAGNITTGSFLKHLGLLDGDNVNVKFERDGSVIEEKISVLPDTNMKRKNDFNYKYDIDEENSLGIFTMNTCNVDDEYLNYLKDFFKEVKEKDIKNIAVDLRNNTGGNSMVINKFIKNLDVDKYSDFGGVYTRFSKEASEERGHLRNWGSYENKGGQSKNHKVEDNNLIFNGKVYILTSNITFSSANDFATTFKDNKIGTLIGEPTGNAPTSYGDILMFQLPNSKFNMSISYKKFFRVDRSKDDEQYLEPDILVNTTREDLINDKDAQIEKLKDVIEK